MPLELLLPRPVTEPRFVCTVPGCGEEFAIEFPERFTRHVRDCARRNLARMEAKVAETKSNYFTTPADVERYEFERRRGTQKGRR
jgi:hypothetical protein